MRREKRGGLGSVTLVGKRVDTGSAKPYLARYYRRGSQVSAGYFATREDAIRALERVQLESPPEDRGYVLQEQDWGDPYIFGIDYAVQRSYASGRPEIGLWAAIMSQAIVDLRGEHEGLRAEAADWVRGEGGSADFVTACELLGLDPDAAREAALGLIGAGVRPRGWLAL